MSSPAGTAKAELRVSLRRARAEITAEDRHDQSARLRRVVVDQLRSTVPPHGDAAGNEDDGATRRPIVAAFLGVPPEPATAPLLEELHAAGFRMVLPVCEPGYRLSWAFWAPGVALERSVRAAVDEPSGPRLDFAELPRVALILVPALGVDRAGHRVGQGGGYYDRFLAEHPVDPADPVPRSAVVYRSELLPAGAVPAEPWDQRLTGIFTPDGYVEVPRTEGPE